MLAVGIGGGGAEIRTIDVEMLGPYITRHTKRFSEHVLDMSRVPEPLEGEHDLPESLLKQPPTTATDVQDINREKSQAGNA